MDRRIDVTELLKSLPRPHREVVVLREIHRLTYAEMARVLKLPQGDGRVAARASAGGAAMLLSG